MFQEGYYEKLGNKLYNKLPDFRAKYASLATVSQISLILGLISDSTRKVKRVLEIGVYNGVTSLYMLKTGIATTPDYKQYGLDISTADFCGEAVLKEATEDELKHFSLHKGKTCLNINEVLDEKDKLDLVFIDGGHSHPWPLLDLVNIIPFLHKDSIICLHDVVDYMRPNAWGESFIYEIWPAAKYRNIAPNGAFETLGIIKLPDNKDVLYKTLIDLARLPFRAAPWAFDEKYLGINKETLLQLEQNMKKHYDPSFVEEFMSLMYSNLEKYEKEYILRIHETRFFNYLYEEIKTLKTDVSKLRNFLTNEPAFLNALNKCRDKKILFWGASVFLKEFLNRNNLSDFNIVGIIDKNTKNNDSKLGKYSVYPPEEIKNLNADLIISSVTNSHDIVHNQIKEFLQKNDIKLKLAPDTFA